MNVKRISQEYNTTITQLNPESSYPTFNKRRDVKGRFQLNLKKKNLKRNYLKRFSLMNYT